MSLPGLPVKKNRADMEAQTEKAPQPSGRSAFAIHEDP
jgi:hypothetical protein